MKTKDIYIKIEPSSMLELQKNLLEANASNIKMELLAEKIRQEMQKEINNRTAVKRQLKEVISATNNLLNILPRTEERSGTNEKTEEKKVPRENKIRFQKETELKKQLEEISKRIASIK